MAWQPLESLKVNPEFFGGVKVTWNRSFLQRTNSKTACQGRTSKGFGVFLCGFDCGICREDKHRGR